MRVAQLKHHWRLLWVKEQKPLKLVTMGSETGISLKNQLMYPLYKEHPGLLLNLHTTKALIF
jgi:hypothetical protein